MARLVKPMALAAAAAADGIMIEVHNNPPCALCDGAQSSRRSSCRRRAACLQNREAVTP